MRSLTPLKRWNLRSGPGEDATDARSRRAGRDAAKTLLLHACHRELLPSWCGLPSLLLLPSPCFTLMNTRFPPSLLPLTRYLRVPQITIPTSLERLAVRDSEVLGRKWWRYLRGDALQWWVLAFRSEPAWHRAGGNDAGRCKKEERRRAFSLLPAPLLRWVEWGTRANYVPQFLSRDFSRRALALAGAKHSARSYSLHFCGPLLSLVLLSSLLLSSLSSPRSSP
ncbi:hypothetical protein B0H13DRAFT_2395138 [Mycena leptocephala]|nr:hypothetical protein B0H13DRAFT_2395138 [Mycena leptocephala]